jgi:hypothetical protein
MADMFKLRVRFVDSSGQPLKGEEYRVAFHDKDVIGSSVLGESGLDGNGVGEAVCATADVRGLFSPGETHPDVFCTLTRGGQQIHKTKVVRNFNPDQTTGPAGRANSTLDLGTITVG